MMEWWPILKELNEELLARVDPWDLETIRDAVPDPSWLGYPGASAAAVEEAEARLGLRFPETYRSLLDVSNGWQGAAGFPNGIASLLPVEALRWLREDRMREHERFREYLRERPELLAPGPTVVDLLDRLLLVGDCDGNELLLLVVSARTDDWPVIGWDPEDGFWQREGLEALFRDELAALRRERR